jgi:hypothetical protein
MLEEERQKLERENEKAEWEATLNLIRNEAKSETDQELGTVHSKTSPDSIKPA